MARRSKLGTGLRARDFVARWQSATAKVATGVRAASQFAMPPRTSHSLAPGTERLLAGKPIDAARRRVGLTPGSTGLGAAVKLARETRLIRSKDTGEPVLKRINRTVGIRNNHSIAQSLAPVASVLGIPVIGFSPKLASTEHESVRPLVVPVDLEKGFVQTRGSRPIKRYNSPGRVASHRAIALSRRARLDSPSFSDLAPPKSAGGGDLSAVSTLALHSAPTVVVRDSGDAGDIEHRVSLALRRHRSELFDEMKREAARRERLRF